MARVPAFAKAFAGRWRIVEMDNWGEDFLDLVEEAHLTFKGSADGETPSARSRASSTFDTAHAMDQPVRSSPGKVTTKMIPPAVVDGP